MTQKFSKLIALGCTGVIFAVPIVAIYFLFNIEQFANIGRNNIALPIQWHTVSEIQWYCLWLLTLINSCLVVIGLYFLRRAFFNFAKGQLFNLSNSRDLRMFSILLFAQAFAKPLYFSISSVILSINHSAGKKMLSVMFGSNELTAIALAMIIWVVSDLLVKGSKLENENKQFI